MEGQDKPVGAEDTGSGRVLVFARVRPPTPWETGLCTACEIDDAAGVVRVRNDADAAERILAGQPAETALNAADSKNFTFDAVFPEHATQRDVFLRVGLPVLRECLKGFNGTVLAYGQTGSGKTHSLLHQGQKAEEAGLLPRLIASLFLQIAQDSKNVYTVDAAVVQVYNEQVDDLLHPDHQSGGGRNAEIQNAGTIPGLTWVTCKRPETMIDAFTRARANLVYAETKLNKASSRSHAVFQIRIMRRERAKGPPNGTRKIECTNARLCVVDLAGSERVKKSGAEGTQFKEATAINRSLLAFGNVVSALAAKKAHVPLRDSKLTRILDGSIGGNCKTALLVCASPAMENTSETLNTFDFASRAMRVEVNAKVNMSVVEVSAKALLADLSEDCDGLGGMPTNAELLELRMKSKEAAERAQTEAKKKDLAIAEVEKQAKKLQQLFEVADQRSKAAQEEAESLRKTQQATKTESEQLRKTLAESEKTAEEMKKLAETKVQMAEELRAKLQAAEKTAKEWQTIAKMREQTAKQEAQKEKVEEVKKQKEEVTRVRLEAQTLTRQATMKQEQALKTSEEAESRAAEAVQRAEVAEREASQLKEQLGKAQASAEAARTAAASAKAELLSHRAAVEEQAQVKLKQAEATLEAERTKAEDALRESSEQAEVMRARHEELLAQNVALETEVTKQAATLVRVSAELTEAKAALDSLRVQSEIREAELASHHRDQMQQVEEERAAEIAALKADFDASSREASQELTDTQSHHMQEIAALEQRLAEEQQKWAEERRLLEAEHRSALDSQRQHFEQKLAELRTEYETKIAVLQQASETRLEDLQRLLDEQIVKTEEEREKWMSMKEEAVHDAWEKGNAQQRRLASAFKAARNITAAKEAELKSQHEELARRFAARESREEDMLEIDRQRNALTAHQRALLHREGQVKGLSLELQNRDTNDRIFSQSEFRNRKRQTGVVPALPGRKLGDTRCFLDRQVTHDRTGHSNARTLSAHSRNHSTHSSSPMHSTCPGAFSSSARFV